MNNINIRQRHRDAMTLADSAYIAKKAGNPERAKQLFADAYTIELELAQASHKEPSRSILYRSAATLALQAELYREAEQAAAWGLIGNVPDSILEELREILEQIRTVMRSAS